MLCRNADRSPIGTRRELAVFENCSRIAYITEDARASTNDSLNDGFGICELMAMLMLSSTNWYSSLICTDSSWSLSSAWVKLETLFDWLHYHKETTFLKPPHSLLVAPPRVLTLHFTISCLQHSSFSFNQSTMVDSADSIPEAGWSLIGLLTSIPIIGWTVFALIGIFGILILVLPFLLIQMLRSFAFAKNHKHSFAPLWPDTC